MTTIATVQTSPWKVLGITCLAVFAVLLDALVLFVAFVLPVLSSAAVVDFGLRQTTISCNGHPS